MSEELLQDLALYKKSHEKAVSIAARSLIGLFREVRLSLLFIYFFLDLFGEVSLSLSSSLATSLDVEDFRSGLYASAVLSWICLPIFKYIKL